jgi:hypothetical protein
MAFFGMWTGKRSPPPPVPSDTIIPTFQFDDTATYRNTILCQMLCFDDVPDPDKLHDALKKLLEIGGWRKLGGRLRLNVSS